MTIVGTGGTAAQESRVTRQKSLTEKRRLLDRRRGISHANVPADPLRRHVNELLRKGASVKGIARASGLDPMCISMLIEGRHANVRRPTGEAVARLTLADIIAATPPTGLVPSTGTTRRIRSLIAAGWCHRDIKARTGIQSARLLHRRSPVVMRRVHDAIKDVYDSLGHIPGPSYVNRGVGRARGYVPPLAWDDEVIDDPDAEPNYGPRPRRQRCWLEDIEELVRLGATTQQIADRLGVARGTVVTTIARARRPDLRRRLDLNDEERKERVA